MPDLLLEAKLRFDLACGRVIPPPLPPPIPRQKTLYHHAAWAGLLAPLLIILFAVAARTLAFAHALPPPLAALIGVVTILTIIAGVVFSTLALCGISSHGKSGLLWQGVVGLLLGLALGLLAGVGAFANLKKATANHQGMRQMQAASHDLLEKAGSDFNPTNGIDNQANLKKIEKFRDTLNALTNQMSGEEAQMMQALNVCMGRWAAGEKAFVAAAEDFQRAGILDFERLQTAAQLARHRGVVKAFLSANEIMRTNVFKQDRELEAELRARQISERNRIGFIKGFNSGRLPLLQRVSQIRDCDRDIGQACLKLYDLLEARSGHWQLNPQTEQPAFDDASAQTSADALLQSIALLGKKEVQIQKEVVQIQQQAARRQAR